MFAVTADGSHRSSKSLLLYCKSGAGTNLRRYHCGAAAPCNPRKVQGSTDHIGYIACRMALGTWDSDVYTFACMHAGKQAGMQAGMQARGEVIKSNQGKAQHGTAR